jgi:hypothetical protein
VIDHLLPDDPRLAVYKGVGWQGVDGAPTTHPYPAGTTTLSALAGTDIAPGAVVRGTTGDFGYPKSVLLIPKSLYAAFGKGAGGGLYGYSWAGAWLMFRGITFEDFRIVCPDQPSPSHFYGKGWNGIEAWSSRLRNVHLENPDNGIFLRGSHSQADDCTVTFADNDADGLERTGRAAHYGFKTTADDSAFVRCHVPNGEAQHEHSAEKSARCAFIDCKTKNGSMDIHANKEWCVDTLWLRHHVGSGGRPFASGGNPIYLLAGHQHVRTQYVDCKNNKGFLDVTKPPKMGPGTVMWLTGAPIVPPAPGAGSGFAVRAINYVNVRQQPSRDSLLLGTHKAGDTGVSPWVLQFDPASSVGYVFVNFASGFDGWVDATKMVRI